MTETFALNFKPISNGTKTDLVFYDSIDELFESINFESRAIVVTDENVSHLEKVSKFLSDCRKNGICVHILPSGEENKTIENVQEILKTAVENCLNRNSLFVALGGGVVSDMSSFAASLYKRGANLEIIPSTLLSMADASIGGKTGCDFGNYKNMIGTFYPARKIHFCREFLATLSDEQYFSGLAEVIKTAMLFDSELFEILKADSEKIKSRDSETLRQIIKRCAIAKSKIVEKDVTEKNIRKQLNLGHTFAHALESTAGFGKVTHGHAVAWGISRCIQLSFNLGLCPKEYLNDVFGLLSLYGYETEKIPQVLQGKPDGKETAKQILQAMMQDKKNESEKITCILQKKLNSTVIQEVKNAEIIKVLDKSPKNL